MSDPLRDQVQTSLGTAYTLGRELDRGGMSRVFVAREEALGRDVVVKVLAPELAAGLSAERFAREIKLAAALQEPHIVPVLTAGVTTEGLPYYTMPYVRGESLRTRLSHGPVPLREAVAILRDVATALEYAHTQGLVHRDIKPENVLLSGRTAVVTDFGIAKALAASKTQAPDGPAGFTLTQAGMSLGTPAYMSPEQAAGDPQTDHRADLYAWGVMAYELLAGRHPFADRTSAAALIAAHFSETAAPLPESVPRPLTALVTRCLAKNQEQRPASSNELLAVLETASTSAERPISAIPHAWGQRRHMVPLALAVVALAVVAGSARAWHARAAAAPVAPPLVAVLPFETTGTSPDTAFADGLGEAITGKLARLQGLRVIDHASVRTIKDAALRPQAAGHDLGADYVLRATLRWARGEDGKPRVQVSPMLVRVTDGTTTWAGEPTVVTPNDPFTAQGALATEVAEALDVALAPADRARLARPPTADTAAFAALERGRRLWEHAFVGTHEDRVQALREFETAYKLDPQYADALGWAANVLQWMAQLGAPHVFYDSAAVIARHALSIDPGQGEATTALWNAETHLGHPEEAREIVERAARAFPSSAELHEELASARSQGGDSTGAVDAVRRLAVLAPRDARLLALGAWVMLHLRRYDDARELLAHGRALEPDAPSVLLITCIQASATGDTVAANAALRAARATGAAHGVALLSSAHRCGDAALRQELAAQSLDALRATTAVDSTTYYGVKLDYFLRGDAARARALADSGFRVASTRFTRAPAGSPDAADASRGMAWFAAARGDRPAAEAALRRAAVDPLITHAQPGSLYDGAQTCATAEAYAMLGDVDAALPSLRRCLTMPNGYPLPWFGDPVYDRVRNDPRVRALVAELTAAQSRARDTPVRAAR